MGNLRELGNQAPQACRLVNGVANRAQGRDYSAWRRSGGHTRRTGRASATSATTGHQLPGGKFGPLNGNRGPGSGKHFIDAYGFDSQTPNSLCFASFTSTKAPGTITNTMTTDRGSRVLDDDPYVPPPPSPT
ncbi:hypothetical protein MAP00_007663 [Monascus purpureus]|nr:hypothetical protein MAP00_007663 [Monascus purpureus]